MAKPNAKHDADPRILNRRAYHDFFIEEKLECGMALLGSEVKSLRDGKAQLSEAFARIERGELVLLNAHIDPYTKSSLVLNHAPRRPRRLLAHKREIRKLEAELEAKGTTLIPLSIYFKGGRAKLELGVGRGKKQYDKRETLKRKTQDREMKRAVTQRQ